MTDKSFPLGAIIACRTVRRSRLVLCLVVDEKRATEWAIHDTAIERIPMRQQREDYLFVRVLSSNVVMNVSLSDHFSSREPCQTAVVRWMYARKDEARLVARGAEEIDVLLDNIAFIAGILDAHNHDVETLCLILSAITAHFRDECVEGENISLLKKRFVYMLRNILPRDLLEQQSTISTNEVE